MALHPFRSAAASTAGAYTGLLLEAGVKRTPLVLADGESLGDFDLSLGTPPLAVIHGGTGNVFFYDATDATTADDGVTCLVSLDGRRYLVEAAAQMPITSVLAEDAAPPGTPSLGDCYIVAVAASGAWSGHDEALALWTRRGWVYATPQLGWLVYNEEAGATWQFGAAGWDGISLDLPDASVLPMELNLPFGVAVEATQNDPPGSPTTGLYYVVGATPTGAWTGQAGKVATWDGAAWVYISPYVGATVYDRSLGFRLVYRSGAWSIEAQLLTGVVSGLKLTNNVTDPTNDIDAAAGSAVDDTGTRVLTLAAGITKRLDGGWAVGSGNGGRDTGLVANGWWYIWLIGRSDTGVVDVLMSQSATSPTMPSNYTHKVRIGEVYRAPSLGGLKPFVQVGDDFWWKAEVQDVADSPSMTSALKTLTVPPEKCLAYLAVSAVQSSGSGVNYVRVHDPDLDDIGPTISNFTLAVASDSSRDATGGGLSLMTDASGQVRHRSSAAFTGTIYVHTRGWRSRRGKPT